MIFVFGSNLLGIHGAGAAKFARFHHGAKIGVGEGITGNSYALPTKFTPRRGMPLSEIQKKINTFLKFAKYHPEMNFQVTQIGCGLGGWHRKDIAPLFLAGPVQPSSNCYFDKAWKSLLPGIDTYWGTL